MKESTRLDKDIRDMKIADKCKKCCLCCKKYKSVKEQNEKCEVRKARGRLINRKINQVKKKKIERGTDYEDSSDSKG